MKRGYFSRLSICIAGLVMYALGNALGVIAGAAGTNGWNTLAIGISRASGLTYGTSILACSFVIIAIDILGKGKLGIGTVLNVFLVAWFSDLILMLLQHLPQPTSMLAGVICTLAGQLVTAFATVVYMSPALGAGPRDTLMVITGKLFPKIPIGAVKFGLEIAALVGGILLGADIGIGTVLVIALQASFFQFACAVCRFEPRDIVQEDLIDTWRILRGEQDPR